MPYMMKEYANGGSSRQEQYFGLNLCSARNVIECSFGRLKARFGALKKDNGHQTRYITFCNLYQ